MKRRSKLDAREGGATGTDEGAAAYWRVSAGIRMGTAVAGKGRHIAALLLTERMREAADA